MNKLGFVTSAISNKHGRKTNQDCFDYGFINQRGYWVVADGLGGHQGGEVASKLAVESIVNSFKVYQEISSDAIQKYFEIAQTAILKQQKKIPALSEMRTTIVLLLADPQFAIWGYAGDTRLYHFRSGQIIYQSKDHSVPQALANAGDINPEEIRFHEDRHRLLRALGQEHQFRPSITAEKKALQNGDAFLLCTDGFWELVLEKEMEHDLANFPDPKRWLNKMQDRILARALERANKQHDNYTAIAVFVKSKDNYN
ncbi:MAG: protein phosphatase 2C domain-containing protein [Desulfotomaculaceae bacterium]|nr:protein phosphatase 2C domain-containing protein [Desulfotomaculaceae bacterium]